MAFDKEAIKGEGRQGGGERVRWRRGEGRDSKGKHSSQRMSQVRCDARAERAGETGRQGSERERWRERSGEQSGRAKQSGAARHLWCSLGLMQL
eukprot:scaffold34577_cov30-Tisochrysis_lutea.AAC.3